MSDLPTGWAISSLKELLTEDGVFSDGDWVESKDQDPSGSIRLLQLADIGDGYFVDKSCRFINEQKFVELRCTELFENDVLIARMPDPLGRACLMPKLPQRCVTVVDVAVFRAGKNGVSGNWLMHTINAPQYRGEIELNSSGTTRKRISRGNLATMPMPVAPLPEQKRIADKLDSVLARVDACRDRLDRLPALLKRFRQSILAAATSGRLTEDWRTQHQLCDMELLVNTLPSTQKARRGVSDTINPASEYTESWANPSSWWKGTAASLLCKGVFHDLKDGNHGANHPVVSDFTDDGLAFITAAQVDRFSIDYDGAYKISGKPLAKLRVGFAQTGDVVLTHKGSVGRVGMIDRDCVLTPQTTYYRSNLEYVLPKFLMYYMASQPFSGQLEEIKSQTTRDFVPITQQYALVHILPPLPEQIEIVRRVEILFAFADRLEARLATARRQVGQLTPSLLAKAFRGELVPQDPADEPASGLLKRLAAQRESAPKTKRSRKIASL